LQIICKQDKILYMNENMARDILKKKGLAATKQRVAIFLKICECSCHFTAGELHHLLAEKEDEETIDLATVYRTINAFENVGLIKYVAEVGNCRYYGKAGSFDLPHAHFHCEECGKLFCLQPLDKSLKEIGALKKKGFRVHRLLVTAEGLCTECCKKAQSASANEGGARGEV
jgi:Fe2+ or Zn2+ uptake regulation protein